MGNSSGKESRSQAQTTDGRPGESTQSPTEPGSAHGRDGGRRNPVYLTRANRSSRHDLSFLGLGSSTRDESQPEQRRETKAEREARKLEKERELRKRERERSLKEEGVDGGYLVTLGTYTGPEDFSKSTVRQLQIERRLAPFWRGLNDHKDTWTEHQLVALAQGLPLPPADEIPPEDPARSASQSSTRAADITHLTIPITGRSQSYNSDITDNLSASHPAFSPLSGSAPLGSPPSSSPFFKGRAKALAALKTSHSGGSQAEMTQQEVNLPTEPYVNGQRVEAFLYKDASECPICFLYYPPYLNKTRCCDQPICSECFVQIKRPDPHPPEHHGDDPASTSNADGAEPGLPEEENQLVSEPAACPFCVQPEFGVSYDPPPFRRGLVHASQARGLSMASATSAMSSSSSLNSGSGTPGGNRRRTTSLSANAPQVITTDRVRPDWAKKLSDARAHALRRAAAATALHNAAYVLGSVGASDGRGLLGRRRRMFAGDGGDSSGSGTPGRVPDSMNLSHVGAMLAAADRERERGAALPGGDADGHRRGGSRRNRMEDLEELMMMEAIRLSLASEEERRRKEEKEAAKQAKKDQKQAEKDAKKAEKAARAARKSSIGGTSFYSTSANASTTSGLPQTPVEGKGKGVDRSVGGAVVPLQEPTSTVNDEVGGSSSSPTADAQRHLEQSRAHLQSLPEDASVNTGTPAINISGGSSHRAALRHMSTASSNASSPNESPPGSFGAHMNREYTSTGSGINLPTGDADALHSETPPGGGAGTEPMFNFRSLAEVIGKEEKESAGAGHVEHASPQESQPGRLSPSSANTADDSSPNRSRGDSGESSNSSVPPEVAEAVHDEIEKGSDKDVTPLAKSTTEASNPYDAKHFGDISMLEMSSGTTH